MLPAQKLRHPGYSLSLVAIQAVKHVVGQGEGVALQMTGAVATNLLNHQPESHLSCLQALQLHAVRTIFAGAPTSISLSLRRFLKDGDILPVSHDSQASKSTMNRNLWTISGICISSWKRERWKTHHLCRVNRKSFNVSVHIRDAA